MKYEDAPPLQIDAPQTKGVVQPVLGWHWFADFLDCKELPTSPDLLSQLLVKAAEMSGATIVQSCFHQFAPFGLSGVVVIAESHIAAHTWPEYRTMCVDFFSCSQKINVDIALQFVRDQVQAGETKIRHEVRGGR